MINLDDFSPFLESSEEKEENPEKEIEKLKLKFQQEIINLQRRFREELEKERKAAFNEGFKEGTSETEQRLNAEFQSKIKSIIEEKDKEFNKIAIIMEQKLKEIEEKNRKILKNLSNSILDNLVEILDYLYISELNKPYIEKVVKELINSFENEEFLKIEAGSKLYEYLKNKGFRVKKNDSLQDCDFRLKFKDFEIESILKEKLKNLREELEKEVRKST